VIHGFILALIYRHCLYVKSDLFAFYIIAYHHLAYKKIALTDLDLHDNLPSKIEIEFHCAKLQGDINVHFVSG